MGEQRAASALHGQSPVRMPLPLTTRSLNLGHLTHAYV